MATFITADGTVHAERPRRAECPHCGVNAEFRVAVKADFELLNRARPERAGLVFLCADCGVPLFSRYRVRAYSAYRIDLHPVPEDIERPRERFSLQHLPAAVAANFSEALTCYSNGTWRAFAAMCRLTARAMFDNLGDAGRVRVFDLARETQRLAGIDDESFAFVRRILFDEGAPSSAALPIDRRQAGLLLETMKDILHQVYIRRTRLRQALRMRRWFAEEAEATPEEATPDQGPRALRGA